MSAHDEFENGLLAPGQCEFGIAFEDIGLADLSTVSFVTAALAGKGVRAALGGEEPPMKQGKLGPLLAIAKTDDGYKYLLDWREYPKKWTQISITMRQTQ